MNNANKTGQSVVSAIRDFQGKVFNPHHPEGACISCVDGREKGGGNFDYEEGVHVLRITEIAAIIPPYESAPANMRAKLSFSKLKDVPVIKVVGHSFCGGAQTVIACPDENDAPNMEVADIVTSIAASGADLPRLSHAFMRACEGNAIHAANLLSRHLALVSLNNISGYPYVNERIVTRKLDVIPLYHVLKEGSGQKSHMERYDVAHKRWMHTAMNFVPNMCDRPQNCEACTTCHDTIDRSLEWIEIEVANDKGQIEIAEAPYHIAGLLSERRSMYQPKLDKIKKSNSTATALQLVPSCL